jgi:uncharacterized protein (DUF362 family)
MDRRNFIKSTSAVLLASQMPLLSKTQDQPNNPIVFEVEEFNSNSIAALFSAMGGIQRFIQGDLSKSIVLIKPNICLPHSDKMGTTSSVQVLEQLCQYLISSGIKKILITDHTLQKSDDFKDMEINNLGKRYKEVEVFLSNAERWYQPVQGCCRELKSTSVLKLTSRADLFINLATAKHHSATHVSLAIKNLMGAIWNRMDLHTKMNLHHAIGDLPLIITPDLNIIDATRVLLTNGPTGPGKVITDNRLFASTDILAVDSVVTSRYNFGGKILPARQVTHLMAAYNNKIGEIELDKITIKKVEK